MLPSEICSKAADLIDARGWATHTYESEDGRLCLLGAVRMVNAQQLNPNFYAALDAIRAVAAPGGGVNLAVWNDDIAKDKQNVINVLREASSRLLEQEQDT